MSQMNCCGSYPSSDAQLTDKPIHEFDLDDNVVSLDEKGSVAMKKLLSQVNEKVAGIYSGIRSISQSYVLI